MPRSTINFDTVRKIGLALPGVEESTAYGSPALTVHGELLACVPAHRSPRNRGVNPRTLDAFVLLSGFVGSRPIALRIPP